MQTTIFANAGRTFDGQVAPSEAPNSINTFRREQSVQDIMSGQGPLEKKLTDVFSNYRGSCMSYVQSKGETPNRQIIPLAAQTCLLRAKDIAAKAESIGMSDEDALKVIESDESSQQNTSATKKGSILPPQLQAAVYLVLDKVAEQIDNGTMADLIDLLQGPSGKNPMNGFAGNDMTTSGMMNNNTNSFDIFDYDNESSEDTSWNPISVSGPGLATVDPEIAKPISISGVTNVGVLKPDAVAGSSDGGGILSFLGSIVSGAQQVASAAGSLAQSSSSIKNSVNQLGGGIGASSISQWINANKGTIALWAVGLVVVIIIIVYAAKNRN